MGTVLHVDCTDLDAISSALHDAYRMHGSNDAAWQTRYGPRGYAIWQGCTESIADDSLSAYLYASYDARRANPSLARMAPAVTITLPDADPLRCPTCYLPPATYHAEGCRCRPPAPPLADDEPLPF